MYNSYENVQKVLKLHMCANSPAVKTSTGQFSDFFNAHHETRFSHNFSENARNGPKLHRFGNDAAIKLVQKFAVQIFCCFSKPFYFILFSHHTFKLPVFMYHFNLNSSLSSYTLHFSISVQHQLFSIKHSHQQFLQELHSLVCSAELCCRNCHQHQPCCKSLDTTKHMSVLNSPQRYCVLITSLSLKYIYNPFSIFKLAL